VAFGPAFANATQITSNVEYSNDSIQQYGVLQACTITAALKSPRAPEIVNLQFLSFGLDGLAYKVTADPNKQIAAANFSAAEFNHPNAFKQSVTPEGQLLAVLIDPKLEDEFRTAFLRGHYSLELKRSDAPEVRTYYVEQGPGQDVERAFQSCLAKIYNSEPVPEH
jgi:hypothetical protein